MRTMGWVTLLAIAGCGGNETVSTSSVTPTPATAIVHVGAGAANVFSPQTVNINPGDTVLWVWDGGLHTVTSGAPGAVDGRFCSLPFGTPPTVGACDSTSYAQGPTAAFYWKFTSAGTFPYFCGVHGAMMTGTIVVGQ